MNVATTSHPAQSGRYASDDEILGIGSAAAPARSVASKGDDDFDAAGDGRKSDGDAPREDTSGRRSTRTEAGAENSDDAAAAIANQKNGAAADEEVQAALDASPELRRAWQEAQSYREAFATPEEARAATALLGDLNRMDALFFSQRPEDHAELARAVAGLDPAAFASLAQAMNALAANGGHAAQGTAQLTHAGASTAPAIQSREEPREILRSAQDDSVNQNRAAQTDAPGRQSGAPSPVQVEFLHAANAAAVQGVLDAIETQVDRLLPDGVSKTARNRVVGEIYRELDGNLAANRQLGQQMRDAFRSGSLDAAHQRAVVALVTGRARQALPGIAKRVLNEWTSTVVAANQDRLGRQRAAAHRVDIAGSGRGGDGGRRPVGPRDIDYGRMSDADILNL